MYQTPTRSTSIFEAELLGFSLQCCFIMHERGDNQLSVAAAVEHCGWSKATRLHVLPTYVSHRCNEYRLCGRKSLSSLCLTDNLECKECCLFTHNYKLHNKAAVLGAGRKSDFRATAGKDEHIDIFDAGVLIIWNNWLLIKTDNLYFQSFMLLLHHQSLTGSQIC